MELHTFSGSGYAWRVQLGLEIKEQLYELVRVEPTEADLRSAAFLAMNPRGKVPVLRDGETTLAESLAILAYLERRFPEPALFGRTPEETGALWQPILDFDLYIGPEWVRGIIAPAFTSQVEAHTEEVRTARAALGDSLARLEAAVARGGVLVGATPNAVDIGLIPFVEALVRSLRKPVMQENGIAPLALETEAPKLATWREKFRALPVFEKTYPAFWRELDAAAGS